MRSWIRTRSDDAATVTVERTVELRDRRQLRALTRGEFARLLPQGEARTLQVQRDALRSAHAQLAPLGAANLVQRSVRPLNDVERVEAQRRLRTTLLDHRADPVPRIGAHQPDEPTSLWAQGVEERVHRALATPLRGPDQATRVVVDHDRQVLVATLVADLVDADAAQAIEPIISRPALGDDPFDDAADRAPGDPHHRAERRLVHTRREPGDGLLEVPGESRAMSGPRNTSDDDTVLRAANANRAAEQHDLAGAKVESSPASIARTRVVPTASTAAEPASMRCVLARPDAEPQFATLLVVNEALLASMERSLRASQ